MKGWHRALIVEGNLEDSMPLCLVDTWLMLWERSDEWSEEGGERERAFAFGLVDYLSQPAMSGRENDYKAYELLGLGGYFALRPHC